MDCHFRDLPDFQSSEARLMTASAVHKLTRVLCSVIRVLPIDLHTTLPNKDLQSRHVIGTEISL